MPKTVSLATSLNTHPIFAETLKISFQTVVTGD